MSAARAAGASPKIVIMPGDTRFNLGDTAICLATIQMMRRTFPSCAIAVWGGRPVADRGFEGVDFHERPSLAAIRDILSADVFVWGGGQLLQGNRSAVKIPYWVLRIVMLRLLGKRIVGFGQGLGPFSRPLDRALVRLGAACTALFTVRDRESLETLLALGLSPRRARLTADPALALVADAPAGVRALPRAPGAGAPGGGKDAAPRPRLGVSLRYTRHHRPGRLIPFHLLPTTARRQVLTSPDYRVLVETMVRLCDRWIEALGVDLVLIPMYYAPWETDVELARTVAGRVRLADRTHVAPRPDGVTDLTDAFDSLDAFVGVPMHSTILATGRHVPTIAIHYEPKGREYMSLLGMEDWALGADELWRPEGPERLDARVLELWRRRCQVRDELDRRIPALRRRALANARYVRAAVRAS